MTRKDKKFLLYILVASAGLIGSVAAAMLWLSSQCLDASYEHIISWLIERTNYNGRSITVRIFGWRRFRRLRVLLLSQDKGEEVAPWVKDL